MVRRSSRRLTGLSGLTDMTSVSREPLRRRNAKNTQKSRGSKFTGADNENGATPCDSRPSRYDLAQTLLNELSNVVDARCRMMRTQSERLAEQISHSLSVTFLKMPKNIRDMKVSTFVGEYGASMENVVMDRVKEISKGMKTPKAPKKTKSIYGRRSDDEDFGDDETRKNTMQNSRSSSKGSRSSIARPPRGAAPSRTSVTSSMSQLLKGASAGRRESVRRTFSSRRSTQITGSSRASGISRSALQSRVSFASGGNSAAAALFGMGSGSGSNSNSSSSKSLVPPRTPAFHPGLPQTPAEHSRKRNAKGIKNSGNGSNVDDSILDDGASDANSDVDDETSASSASMKVSLAAIGATRKGKGKGKGKSRKPPRDTLVVQTAQGDIDLSSPSQREGLKNSAEAREAAVLKLQELKSQVSALVDQLMDA